MTQEIFINVTLDEIRIALLTNSRLKEIFIERTQEQSIVGNIYKGKVARLLPGIKAAFIDIGLNKAAFLHLSDVLVQYNPESTPGLDIRDYLTLNQDIIVQVYKDPLSNKGPRVTTQIGIPSRYLVFTPGSQKIATSQKIIDEDEISRLTNAISPSSAGGFIFRTAAVGVSVEAIAADKIFLEKLWQTIQQKISMTAAKKLVFQELPLYLKILRDVVNENFINILVDNKPIAEQMQDFAQKYMPHLASIIHHYADTSPLFLRHDIEKEIQKALHRQIFLKSGAYLIFDQTEAMTTIDVNTGSAHSQAFKIDTILQTNLEAVEVIAHQLRLRNLGGIIIIDFIDMYLAEQKEQIIAALQHALADDTARIQVSELTTLGLVQLTRQRVRESLEQVMSETCPTCHGRGHIKSPATLFYEIVREMLRLNSTTKVVSGFVILLATEIAEYFQQNYLSTLQALFNVPLQIKADAQLRREYFTVFPQLN